MTRGHFLALSNSALKVVSGKKYSKVGIILEVNNDVAVERWIAKICIADYTNTSLHGFAYFIFHSSFKRPFFVGKKLLGHVHNLPYSFSRRFIILHGTMWADIFCVSGVYDLKNIQR